MDDFVTVLAVFGLLCLLAPLVSVLLSERKND